MPSVTARIRPMAAGDVGDAEETWSEAFGTMRARQGLPAVPPTDESTRLTRSRIAHLLATDPGGSWIAEGDDGRVVGLAQALVRGDLWVLSLLGVATSSQDRRLGRALLDAAQGYGAGATRGMILSSPDPRAMRRYVGAGFELHPCVTAGGTVDRGSLRVPQGVRAGGEDDAAMVADLDRRARGAAHGPDLSYSLAAGCTLWVAEGHGYAVARTGRPVFLAADDDRVAADLLRACLHDASPDDEVSVSWITAGQQWAIRVALEAGLALRPMGPVMLRGMAPPRPYLPSGAFG